MAEERAAWRRFARSAKASAALALGLVSFAPAWADERGAFEERHDALERGLAFLATQQDLEPDGSFPAGEVETWSPVGVTSICALAFLAGGSTPGRGPHQDRVERALTYLLDRVAPAHSPAPGYIHDEGDHHSRMHGHGLATLALAQAYSVSPSSPLGRRTAEALDAALACIASAQTLEGGWYYEPEATTEHEGSITVCIVQALRAAKDSGLHVESQIIARAVDYVRRLQQENGGFAYALSLPEKTSVALTAAGLATLHATGEYEGSAVQEAYDWLWRELLSREQARSAGDLSLEARFPFYERFYLAQALWQNPDRSAFERWFAKERELILRKQRKDGSWVDRRYESGKGRDQAYGSCYSTAMNCLFLALPDGILPIFQR